MTRRGGTCGNGAGNGGTANAAGRTRAKKRRPAAGHDPVRLLSARRETAASAFRKSVPRPAYRPPKQAPSLWERVDLSDKLPMYPGHDCRGPLVFHKGPMGSNPVHVTPDRDEHGRPRFSLSDPYCRDVSYEYNPLHDPYLKGWLTSSGTCELLLRQGLVTDDLDVVCGLKEHNEYRRFLGRGHDDAIAIAAREKNACDLEYNKISAAVTRHKINLDKTIQMIENKHKKRVKFPVKKKRPEPKRETVTKKLPKGRTVDINEIKTYTEYGRHPDGRIDLMQYRGTYMEGCYDDYYLWPNAKRFFKPKPRVGVERQPIECDLATKAAER